MLREIGYRTRISKTKVSPQSDQFEAANKSPAYYDDLLTLRTSVVKTTAVRIDHRYELLRDRTLLAEGTSTLACVDRQGQVQRLPEFLMEPEGPA